MSEVNHQTLESVKHQLGNGNIANASQQFAKIANNGSAEWYALAGRLASAHGNLDHAARLFLRAHLKAPSNPFRFEFLRRNERSF